MYSTAWIKSSVLAVVFGVALAAPAAAATPDAWITTKTKLALLTTEGVQRNGRPRGHRPRPGHLARQGALRRGEGASRDRRPARSTG